MKGKMTMMLVAGVLALAGCKGGERPVELLKSHEWQLESMTADGVAVKNPSQLPVLSFGDSTRMAGSAGCNRFFGSYATGKKGALTLQPGGTTMMYCPDMEFEGRYLKALSEVATYEVTADALTLKDAGGKLVLVYRTK